MRQIAYKVGVLLTILPVAGWGGLPKTMSYQGILADDSGVPIDDGDYTLTFRIHDEPSAGSILWEESQTVAVVNGIFAAPDVSAAARTFDHLFA